MNATRKQASVTSETGRSRQHLLGIDIGGTFIDLVRFNMDDGTVEVTKAPTTPRDLTAGIRTCLDKSQTPMAQVGTLFHGSTVVINTIIEKTGAKTGLVTTRGFRDVLEIRRGNRPENYNLFYQKPVPLVPRHLRFEVNERLAPDGTELKPVDMADVDRVIEAAKEHELEAIAVCFLHAYANADHEKEVLERLQAALPAIFICASHEIVREWREFERSSTTVLNAFVGPRVERYIERLEANNADVGFDGRFYLMQSSGGVMTPERAKRFPVAMVESGPVSGMIGAGFIGDQLGEPKLIGFDMGGTTAKACFIENGTAKIHQLYHINGYAHGYPLMVPTMDVVEVGTGGGSMAWIDDMGALKVGPRSAGSEPGPVCNRMGGTEPTVTDANVILGRINKDRYLGGEMLLDVNGAEQAMIEKVGKPFGLDLTSSSAGILKIANSAMSLGVRAITIEKGIDPRDCAMIVFGGGGPLHGCDIARDIGVPRVIIPTHPAVFSALGMILSDLRHDLVRTCMQPFPPDDFTQLNTLAEEMLSRGRSILRTAGVDEANIHCTASLDLRYLGQQWTLPTPIDEDHVDAQNADKIRDEFNKLYEIRFGHSFANLETEVVNVRVVAVGRQRKPEFPVLERRTGELKKDGLRGVCYDGEGFVETPIYYRGDLRAGDRIVGPAIIEEAASTTVIGLGDVATVDDRGYIIVNIKGGVA